VFDFLSHQYVGENVVLDQDLFNQQIREDIIHRVMVFNREYNRKTFKFVRRKGDVAGSNRKPFQQKKTGRAPQGDIRAPHMYHGGRAHGARPRDYYFDLNKKVRLLGLKSMLTTKLLEKKIIIVNSEQYEGSAEELYEMFGFLKEQKTIFVTNEECDPKFTKDIVNVNFINHLTADVRIYSITIENECFTFAKP
jgi:large subunit ribosomal protein L4